MGTLAKTTIAILSLFALAVAYILYPSASGLRKFDATSVTTFSKDFVNVFLVSQGEKHLLIDAGLPNHQAEIEDFIRSNGIAPGDLSAIIVTHAHHDHAGTAAYFQKRYGVKIIAGVRDLSAFEKGANGKLCPTSLLAQARYNMDQSAQFPPFTPDFLINRTTALSSLIDVEGTLFNVAAHTPGSLVIVMNDSAFVGDLFRGGLLWKHAAAMHFYQCDLQAVRAGMKHVLNAIAPHSHTFFPSHLGPVTRDSLHNMLEALGPKL